MMTDSQEATKSFEDSIAKLIQRLIIREIKDIIEKKFKVVEGVIDFDHSFDTEDNLRDTIEKIYKLVQGF
jgi:hypothetical protein